MGEPTLQEILPSDTVYNAGTQARVMTDQKTVQSYAESMQDGIESRRLTFLATGNRMVSG
jgi:hypothetical protein